MMLSEKDKSRAVLLFEDYYKPKFDETYKKASDYFKAKREAKEEVYKIDEFLMDGDFKDYTNYFWTLVANYVSPFSPTYRQKDQAENTTEKVVLWDDINWMSCWRMACKEGFVPFGKYVASFVPDDTKVRLWSSYKWHMEKEGWVFEPLEYGWKTTYVEPEPEPEVESQPMFYVTRDLIDKIITETVERLKKSF